MWVGLNLRSTTLTWQAMEIAMQTGRDRNGTMHYPKSMLVSVMDPYINTYWWASNLRSTPLTRQVMAIVDKKCGSPCIVILAIKARTC